MLNRLLHSHAAIRCLERLLDLVADDGFILVNDYGPTQTTREDDFEETKSPRTEHQFLTRMDS